MYSLKVGRASEQVGDSAAKEAWHESQFETVPLRVLAAQSEKRPGYGGPKPEWPWAAGQHSDQSVQSASADQVQEYGFGAVIEGVPGNDRRRAGFFGPLRQI